ncbi:hypothetical protein TUM4438_31410 [Shewanella sairae]|uniref:Uncharacterized protein n=1 Tax=Shewanella sairae TaxID=190310 RepID=A0ABQ4PLF2_9GAMM|nr:hypothetical protein TUM4438_31410 [Shewanella sairae]
MKVLMDENADPMRKQTPIIENKICIFLIFIVILVNKLVRGLFYLKTSKLKYPHKTVIES